MELKIQNAKFKKGYRASEFKLVLSAAEVRANKSKIQKRSTERSRRSLKLLDLPLT
jgi:hypothetical protein